MRFMITSNQIHQNVHEMQNLSCQMQELLEKSGALFMRMHEMWDSPEAQQHTSIGLEQVRECMKLVDTMNRCADIWMTAAAEYEKCEESIANEIASRLFR